MSKLDNNHPATIKNIQQEIEDDEYRLERYVKQDEIWFDAGIHYGMVTDAIHNLDAIVGGFAEIDKDLWFQAMQKYPFALAYEAFNHHQLLCCQYDGAKIDIQGGETELFHVKQDDWVSMPRKLIIEWHKYIHGIDVVEIVATLAEQGYSVSTVKAFDAIDQEQTDLVFAEREFGGTDAANETN